MITAFTTFVVGGWSENWRVMLSIAFNFWAKKCWSTNIKTQKIWVLKIRPVTAEIMLIWTIVARTNVD